MRNFKNRQPNIPPLGVPLQLSEFARDLGLVFAVPMIPDAGAKIVRDYANYLHNSFVTPTWTTDGQLGHVASFAGAGYIDTGVESVGGVDLFCDGSQPFTVAGWSKVANNVVGYVIARRLDAAGTTSTFSLQYNRPSASDATPRLNLRGINTATNWALDDDSWHFITITYNGAVATIYYDNALGGMAASVGSAAEETGQRILYGARANGAAALITGQMGPQYIANRAWPEADIKELYSNPYAPFEVDQRLWIVSGGVVTQTQTATHKLDTSILKTQSATHNLFADLLKTQNATHILDSSILKTQSTTHILDSNILKTQSANITALFADLLKSQSAAHTFDSSILKTQSSQITALYTGLLKTQSSTFTLFAFTQAGSTATHALFADLLKTQSATHILDSVLLKTQSVTHVLDSSILKTQSAIFALDSGLLKTQSSQITALFTDLLKTQTATHILDSVLSKTQSTTLVLWTELTSASNTRTATYVTFSNQLKTQTANCQLMTTLILGALFGFVPLQGEFVSTKNLRGETLTNVNLQGSI